MNRGQQLLLLGGIGLLLGAFLPWATMTSPLLGVTISKAGYEGDGMLTGGIGLLLLIGSVIGKGKPGKYYSVAGAIFAVIAGLTLLFDLSNINSLVFATESEVMARVGPGIYLSIVGAVIAFFGGLQKVPAVAETPSAQPHTP